MDDPVNENMINQSVRHITVVAIFQYCVVVVGCDPKYEAPNNALGCEIMTHED